MNQWSLWEDYVGDSSADDWWEVFERQLRTSPAGILRGPRDPMDFPRLARDAYGLEAIELEASLHYAHVRNDAYFARLRQQCDASGVRCVVISNMWEGNLASLQGQPEQTARNYHRWVDIAAIMGCRLLTVNVNARRGNRDLLAARAAEGLVALTSYSGPRGITVLVENHGWYSAYPPWLVGIMETVNSPFCKLSVDLGNFCTRWDSGQCVEQQYDPYEGVALMMPHARHVSAKMLGFDERGNDVRTDYVRMLRIIRDAGYQGYIGIEYAGDQLSPDHGIRASLALLRRATSEL